MQERTLIWVVAALLAGASATTPVSEVAALRDFYGALGGDGWLDSDGWNSARDPCGGARSTRPPSSEAHAHETAASDAVGPSRGPSKRPGGAHERPAPR